MDEMARKMRQVEAGEWCDERESLLKAFAAGMANEDEVRQAEKHLSHCKPCSEFVARLSGHLHDLGSAVVVPGALDSLDGHVSLPDRIGELVDRVRGGGQGQTANEAASLATSGRGTGAVGGGVAAKVASLGSVESWPPFVSAAEPIRAPHMRCDPFAAMPNRTSRSRSRAWPERSPTARAGFTGRRPPVPRSWASAPRCKLRNDNGSRARVFIADRQGREVRRVANGDSSATNWKRVQWDAADAGHERFTMTLSCETSEVCAQSDQAKAWVREVRLKLRDEKDPVLTRVAGSSSTADGCAATRP